MARCGQCGEVLTGCQCSMADSDCYQITGDGSAGNPFRVVPIIDPAANNMFDCSLAGQGAFLPPEIENPPTCRAFRTIPQIIPNNTDTILIYNDEEWDVGSMHDNAVNGDRLTGSTPGVYATGASVEWEGSSSGDRKIWIRQNGLDVLGQTEDSADASDAFSQSFSTQAKLASGDYLQCLVRQDSGGDLQILVSPVFSPHFWATRIAVG